MLDVISWLGQNTLNIIVAIAMLVLAIVLGFVFR